MSTRLHKFDNRNYIADIDDNNNNDFNVIALIDNDNNNNACEHQKFPFRKCYAIVYAYRDHSALGLHSFIH